MPTVWIDKATGQQIEGPEHSTKRKAAAAKAQAVSPPELPSPPEPQAPPETPEEDSPQTEEDLDNG